MEMEKGKIECVKGTLQLPKSVSLQSNVFSSTTSFDDGLILSTFSYRQVNIANISPHLEREDFALITN
jgi:hypothetical protein